MKWKFLTGTLSFSIEFKLLHKHLPALSSAFLNNSSLTKLSVVSCALDAKSAKPFSDLLSSSKSLKELVLMKETELTAAGWAVLVRGIAMHSSLAHLCISGKSTIITRTYNNTFHVLKVKECS